MPDQNEDIYTFELTVPNDANEFEYDGESYGANSTFVDVDPCEAIGFSNAYLQQNPNGSRFDVTKDFWAKADKACEIKQANAPVSTSPETPTSNLPPEGDSAESQGAPPPPSSVSGEILTGSGTLSTTEEERRPPEGEQHPTHADESPQQQIDAGEPVDIFNGIFYLQETDLDLPNTILPIIFSRIYRSGAPAFGPLGWNWDHNHNVYLRELNDGNIALWRNLHEDIFINNGASFEPPRGVFEQLERVTGLTQTYELKVEGGVAMRFERPFGWIDGERIPLVWIKDRHGNKLQYTYGTEDKIIEVKDDDNRYLRFNYDINGFVTEVSDHAGRKYTYEYNEETEQLVYVNSPPTTDQPNGSYRVYYYDKYSILPELKNNIIRIEDSEGRIYLENKYEEDPASWSYARIKEQLYGGFLFQYRYTQLQYVPSNSLYINIPAVRVEVLNPDFGLETYTFNYRGDLLDERFRLNKDKTFRVVILQYEYDEQGNLSKIIEPNGSSEILTYDFTNDDPRMRGKLLQKELTSSILFPAPSRIVWRGKYEPNYQLLTEETNESHMKTEYKYDFDNTPVSPTNTGKLEKIIYPDVTLLDGTIQNCIYLLENNQKAQIEAIILPDGTRHELVYGIKDNEKSRVIKKIFDVNGLNIENYIAYDSYGYESEMIDGNGNISKNIYNALGLIEKSILPPVNGISAEYIMHYDSDKKLMAMDRPKGNFTDSRITGDHIIDKFQRNVLGYPTKYHLSSNTNEKRDIKICSDFRGYPLKTINPDDSLIIQIYDERGLLTHQEVKGTDGKTLSVNHIYDTTGRLIKEFNSYKATTIYGYDGFGRLKKIIFLNGTKKLHEWGKNDLLLKEEIIGDDGSGTNRLLSKKSYVYDEKNRQIKTIEKSFADDPNIAIDVITTFYYDKLDQIEKIVDNRGGVKTFQYDGLGQLLAQIDPMGNEEHNTYDNNGNLIQTDSYHKEPDGSVSLISKKYVYDARNRRIETIEPDGTKFIEKYDDRNLVVSQTDYLGIIKETMYNSFQDRIIETYDVGGLSVTHQWILDNMSRVNAYTDPTGEISKYHYDSVGRFYKTEYPNGFSSTRVFNDIGQLKEEVLGSGVKFEYGYDNANRLLSIKNTGVPKSINQLKTHEFTYDGLDRVVSAKTGKNKMVRKYDSVGRLLLERTHQNDIVCNYDDNAGTVEKIWPDGRTEKYSHDLNGIITTIEEITNGSLGAGANLIASLKPSGNYLGEASYQGGLKIANKYDERKRLVELAINSPTGLDEKIKYRYDKANRMHVEAIIGKKSKISYFEFDNKNRLVNTKDNFDTVVPDATTQAEHDIAINTLKVASAGAAHEEKFEYDSSDARTKYTETGSVDKNYTYRSGHRIKNDGTNDYSYHLDGTLESDGVFKYEVDALGRVVQIKSGINEVCEIEYDAFGRPSIIKELNKPDKSLNYLGGFLEQENENGIASRQISMHPVTGVPIAYHSRMGTHYTLFDNKYNLWGLADTNGDLLETYRYKSFGVPEIYDSKGDALVASNFGIDPFFGGEKLLSSAGLYLSKRRLMNPLNGVFLSCDPQGYADSPSLYVYAAQNPVNNIDPNGELIPVIVGIFVIGGLIAGTGYSIYDSINHLEKYQGAAGIWRPVVNVIGGGLAGAASILAGEGIIYAAGGASIFGAGTATLSIAKSFALYGASSAFSGLFLRSGFHLMFPDYIDPVSPRTIGIDFVTGGALGATFRAMANYVASPGFVKTLGGSTTRGRSLGPYSGRIGRWLNRIGIRKGYESFVRNKNLDANLKYEKLGRHDLVDLIAERRTDIHEWGHTLFDRYLPTLRYLSDNTSLGGIASFPEEVVTYSLGHAAVGEIHRIPFAPFEALGSVAKDLGMSEAAKAAIFWSRAAGAGAIGIAEYFWASDKSQPTSSSKK